MGLTWYDGVLFLPLAAIVIFETRQEFGRGLFDTAAAAAALYFASRWSEWAGDALQLGTDPFSNSAIGFGLLFAALLIAGLAISRGVHRQFRLSLEQFDPLFGIVTGLAVAVIVGHAVTSVLVEYHAGAPPLWLANSRLADELINWHSLRAAAGSVQQMVFNP